MLIVSEKILFFLEIVCLNEEIEFLEELLNQAFEEGGFNQGQFLRKKLVDLQDSFL